MYEKIIKIDFTEFTVNIYDGGVVYLSIKSTINPVEELLLTLDNEEMHQLKEFFEDANAESCSTLE